MSKIIRTIYIGLIMIIFMPMVLLFTFITTLFSLITSGVAIVMSIFLIPAGDIDSKFIKIVRRK